MGLAPRSFSGSTSFRGTRRCKELEELLLKIQTMRSKLEKTHQELHGVADIRLGPLPEFKTEQEAKVYERRLTEMLEGLHIIIHSWGEWERKAEWVEQDDDRRGGLGA